MYNFNEVKENKEKIKEWLRAEFRSLQTGRATPSVLDRVSIDMYGSRTQIAHCAAISIEDSKTLRVSPWDKGIIRDIEKAINEADLGLSVSSDAEGIRVHFPALTTESRQRMVKTLKEKLEDARIKLRSLREDTNKDIDAKEKAGEFTEDDKRNFREEMQEIVDIANKEFDELFAEKEKDILGE